MLQKTAFSFWRALWQRAAQRGEIASLVNVREGFNGSKCPDSIFPLASAASLINQTLAVFFPFFFFFFNSWCFCISFVIGRWFKVWFLEGAWLEQRLMLWKCWLVPDGPSNWQLWRFVRDHFVLSFCIIWMLATFSRSQFHIKIATVTSCCYCFICGFPTSNSDQIFWLDIQRVLKLKSFCPTCGR